MCGLVAIANAKSTHVFSMDDSSLHTVRSPGNITIIKSKEFPILKRLSMRRLILELRMLVNHIGMLMRMNLLIVQ
jgi:hypothetical protein